MHPRAPPSASVRDGGTVAAMDKPAFAGQIVVVTGAGSGIGRAVALGFAANGAQVVAADIDLESARRTCAVIESHEAGGLAVQVDVASATEMEQFAAWVSAEVGVPDVVVNNAGIAIIGPFLEHTEADWDRIVGVNLLGVARGCRVFGTQMVERGTGGHLVNVASVAAWTPATALPAYAATKAGVLALSTCLRAELAGARIGVTAVCPGFISTGIARAARYVGTSAAEEDSIRDAAAAGLARRNFPPEKVALAVMRAVLANKAVVPVNTEAWITYALSRLSPELLSRIVGRAASGMPRLGERSGAEVTARHRRA
jgi:NAD(P)-dependent dehydrogenase (short-subunit alcohol dehydrogenase family)